MGFKCVEKVMNNCVKLGFKCLNATLTLMSTSATEIRFHYNLIAKSVTFGATENVLCKI